MDIRFSSWDGHTEFNDGERFEAWFPRGSVMLPIPSRSRYLEQPYTEPAYVGTTRQVQTFRLEIKMLDDFSEQISYIKQHFNPNDRTRKKLLITDDSKNKEPWYAYCKVIDISNWEGQVVTIVLERTSDWYSEWERSASWSLTASGQTKKITPGGNIDARPILTVTPTSNKSGGYAFYNRFARLRNPSDTDYPAYIIDITDGGLNTAALIGAGKMRSDGYDLRVRVNGVEVPRWIDGLNTTSTKVWIVIDIPPRAELTLTGPIASSGAIASINVWLSGTAQATMQRMPSSGWVIIDSEVFAYRGKQLSDPNNLKLLSPTRALWNTSEAAHIDGSTIRWFPYEIQMVYGDPNATVPDQDESQKPIINLSTSSNTVHDYDEFMEVYKNRAGAWLPKVVFNQQGVSFAGYFRGDSSLTRENPAIATGMGAAWDLEGTSYQGALDARVAWSLHHPAGVTHIAASGTKYGAANMPSVAGWVDLDTQTNQYLEKAGSVGFRYENQPEWANVTGAFTQTITGSFGSEVAWSWASTSLGGTYQYLRFFTYLFWGPSVIVSNNVKAFVVKDVTLTLDATRVPVVSLGSETGSGYRLAGKLTNQLTDEWLMLDCVIDVNQSLEIDCDAKQVTSLKDNTPAQYAVSALSTSRPDWLNLRAGEVNTLLWEEAGLTGTTVEITWRDRRN
jgi:hypothetical protein